MIDRCGMGYAGLAGDSPYPDAGIALFIQKFQRGIEQRELQVTVMKLFRFRHGFILAASTLKSNSQNAVRQFRGCGPANKIDTVNFSAYIDSVNIVGVLCQCTDSQQLW